MRRRYTLRFNITVIFTALILAISAIVVSYVYERNSRTVLALADTLIQRTDKDIVERIDAFFQPVGAAVSGLAVLARDQERLARNGSLFPLLTSMLRDYPQLQSLYFAFQDDGSFVQAFAVPPGAGRYGPNDSAMAPGTAFAWRTLSRRGGRATDEWVYLDAGGRELKREFARSVTYDARSRPWYQASVTAPGLHWSDITIFTSTQLPGLTPSVPIFRDGKLVGAAAANVTLDRVSRFLGQLEIGRNGIAFIMDREQRLIAYPEAGKVVRQETGGFVQASAEEAGSPWVAEAVRQYRGGRHGRFPFSFGGRQYLASFSDLAASLGKPWVVAIVVPADDFVGQLKRTNQDIVFVVLGVTLVGVLLVGLFARMISRPLTQMAGEADKVRKFDLAEGLEVQSRIIEVQRLGDSLAAMKAAVQGFARYVPRELVRDLMASGQALAVGGQPRYLTVMFTDIRSFTGIAEKMPAQELVQHISEHFDLATRVIGETGGTVDKFIGDSVMAFWGAPTMVENQGERACRAALAIRARMAELNERWAREGKPQLFVRFGIHADTVVVGNIGSPERLSYTALGDGVVVAQRLEGVNKNYGTQICVSQTIYREIGDRFVLRPLDLVAVKGRRAVLQIYELLGCKAEVPGLPPMPAAEADRARKTHAAFDAYLDRRWQEALDMYSVLAADNPDDPVPAMFVGRCRHYLAHPPGDDWSGLWRGGDT